MKLKSKTLLASVIVLCILLVFTLSWYKPWQSEVWISTDKEAFLGPHPGTDLVTKKDRKIILLLSITPAPWPKEAWDILHAAKLGKLVHVTVHKKDLALKFDIKGIAPTGEVLVQCSSEEEAKEIISALQI